MNTIKESFLFKYNMSPLYIKPRNDKNPQKEYDDDLTMIDSPCLKREKSLASTIGSPYTRSYKSEEDESDQINDFMVGKICFNFSQKGYCLNGAQCNDIHNNLLQEDKQVTAKNNLRSTMLKNFPELLIQLYSSKIKLFCH